MAEFIGVSNLMWASVCESDIDRALCSPRMQLKEVKPRAAVLAAQMDVLSLQAEYETLYERALLYTPCRSHSVQRVSQEGRMPVWAVGHGRDQSPRKKAGCWEWQGSEQTSLHSCE